MSGPDPSFWQHKRVLLTGHTGFKGAWLALWLQQLGAEVHGLALPPDPDQTLFPALGLQLSEDRIDLRDQQAVQRSVLQAQPQIVLHLAAQPLVRRSYADPVGTWSTNVLGSLHLLEALKPLTHPCAVVMVTTDKVYANREWDFGYREEDRLGGHDPYSASKAAAELAIASWRDSFCGHGTNQTPHMAIASARAGNVIGGGDWAEDRIVPDAIRYLASGEPIPLRHPGATRPWQHVLEPLGGYLLLAQKLATCQSTALEQIALGESPFTSAYNFGPSLESNRSVRELVETALTHWPGSWLDHSDPQDLHEAGRLHLQIDKAHHQLGWRPCWPFSTTVERTMGWYQAERKGASALSCCLADLQSYQKAVDNGR